MKLSLIDAHVRARRNFRLDFPLQFTTVLVALAIAACGTSEEPRETEEVGTLKSELTATYSANLNGDAWNDRIFRTAINEFKVALATSATTFGPERIWVQHGGPFQDAQQAQFIDLNGDGKMDMSYRGVDNSFWMSISTGSGFLPPSKWVQHGGGYHPDQAKFADLNNDKKMDLIFRGLDNSFWVSISAGTGFLPPSKWMQHGGSFAQGQAQYPDLNGDKKADLAFQGVDNSFWVNLSTGTGFSSPTKWLQHGGGYAPGQAAYADLNADGKADLTFHGGGSTDWISFSTGTSFTAPYPRDPTCGNAFGCLRVQSTGLPSRVIDAGLYEPHYWSYVSVLKDFGLIKAGERITLNGVMRSELLSSGGYGPNTNTSDWMRFSVPAGVTVSATTYNESGWNMCGSGTYNYYTDFFLSPQPWTTEGFIRTTFINSCQALGTDLISPYTVTLQATKGQIYLRVEGPGGPYTFTGTSKTWGVPAGIYSVKVGTDADSDGVLCEVGDFCRTGTVNITGAAMQTLTLSPI